MYVYSNPKCCHLIYCAICSHAGVMVNDYSLWTFAISFVPPKKQHKSEISLPLGMTYILSLPLALQGEVVHVHIGSSWHRFHLVALRLLVLIFLDQFVVQWRPGVHGPPTVSTLHSRYAGQHCHCLGHVGTTVFYLISTIICTGKDKSSVFRCYILVYRCSS